MKENAKKIVQKSVDDLIPYDKNPRKNENAVDKVANSIREFGFNSPIIIDEHNVILCGHTRLKAAKKLGLDKVPCIIREGLTDAEYRRYRIADNKVGELAEWDEDLLNSEMEDLGDMTDFGFEDEKILDEEKYVSKSQTPIYEPKGECPDINELYDKTKTTELKAEIEQTDIPSEIKEFLKTAAERHTVFDFSKIAEYYAHANKEVQGLMENSALVIIDYDKAVERGFTDLKKDIFGDDE